MFPAWWKNICSNAYGMLNVMLLSSNTKTTFAKRPESYIVASCSQTELRASRQSKASNITQQTRLDEPPQGFQEQPTPPLDNSPL
jgi:hypothetical protein